MDFMYKVPGGIAYQLHFTCDKGLCLSPFKKYKAIIIDGQCVSWCEYNDTLDYSPSFKIPKGSDYKVLDNIDCWDLFLIFESEHNRAEDLLELCYDRSSPKNELTDDTSQ